MENEIQYMGLNEIRERYLSFFESKGHLRLPSFPLIPQNDKSLLLINAGMAPLKPYFTGQLEPPRKRVTTCQKCIRTPDIERVGKTARHGTFFEMLGNFSFGDYFKHEATAWAWEFITKDLKLPVSRLYVSVYEDDDEAYDIWTKEIGVDPSHMVRMGKEDNFWEIGTGPCGPCSEIYFDRGEHVGCGRPDCKVGCDCDRFIEFWNLVFTQFDKDADGNYNRLEHANIDTGMGLERLACIMQGVPSLFDVDTIRNVTNRLSEIAGVKYGDSAEKDVSLRVVTDHIRSTTFLVSDGVLPSNEGRGYVLRRLLRRAARHGKLLGIQSEHFLSELADVVIRESGNAYPELVEKEAYIKKVIYLEEERFNQTLDQGLQILNEMMAHAENGCLSGADTFKLYDTFGFPVDLTAEILAEKNMTYDEAGFAACMDEQRTRAREGRGNMEDEGWKAENELEGLPHTEFVGYTQDTCTAKVLAVLPDGEKVTVVLDQTSFYAESGGQVGDSGRIIGQNAEMIVEDCKKRNGIFLHKGTFANGVLSVGDTVTVSIDTDRRNAIRRNHSAAHLIQAALRTVLGDHVHQTGSYVDEARMRFDFSHFEAMSAEQIAETERLVNASILANLTVTCEEMPIEEAKKKGAMALFGEKYGNVVRVVTMGDVSTEFCGGCHVSNTGNLGLFHIVSESGIAAGVRRVEAVTGLNLLALLAEKEHTIQQTAAILKSNPTEVVAKAESVSAELKAAQKQIAELNTKLSATFVDELLQNAKTVGTSHVIVAKVAVASDVLRGMCDILKQKDADVVAVLASVADGKVTFASACGANAVKNGNHAGNLVKQAASVCCGGGGGRPDSACAGGKDCSKLNDAFAAVLAMIH